MPSGSQESASIPEAPPVIEGVPDPVPPPPADGLHRFIIRPAVPVSQSMSDDTPDWATDDDGTSGESTESEEPAGDEGDPAEEMATAVAPPRDPAWTLDQSLADRIDDDTVVVFENGIPGFYDDGVFVPLIGNSAASSGTPVGPTTGSVTEDDVIDELLDIDGVVSAVAIGDGTFAVVAEDDDVLDGRGLDPIVDTPFALAADPYEPYQWTLDNTGENLNSLNSPPNQTIDADIDGLEAKAGARGAGIVVAVIDTGVDFSHPDLAGQSWVNEDETCTNLIDDDGNGFVDDCNGWDFGNEDNQSYGPGQQEHGTHVAGTIAAIADNGVGVVGMAPEVTIMDLNVEGPGGMTMSGISRAVRYAADNGADIINMSLGTQPGTPAAAVSGLIEAVRYAEARGSLVVVAAGNSSVNLDSSPVYPANIEGSNMITVGASAPDETKASFSNYGSPVDLFAPGVLIVSTVPGGGYKFMNGTSMASPTVAGAAAAVLSAFPDLDPLGVREQLIGTGDEAPSYGGLATNPVRINQAWAVGLDGDPEVTQVAVAGLVDATTDGVVADISMTDPGEDYTEPYRWEVSLIAIADGQAYGLVDHPLSIDWQDDETDDQGAVALADGGDATARLATKLPPGTYGLVVEAVPEADPTMRLGDAFVSTFVVPSEPEPEPDPGDGGPTTTTPDGATTTAPPAPGPSTTAGGPTTTQWSTTTSAWPPTVSSTTTPALSTTSPPTTAAPSPTTSSPPATGSPTTSPPATQAPTTTPPTPPTSPQATAAPTTGAPTTASPTTGAPTTASPTTGAPTTGATTTVPPTTTPTTTGSPTTVQATTVPSTSPPTTTVEGGFVLSRISPTAGYINQQTMVSLDGTFPSMVNVWFGDQPGQLVHHSSTWIIVVAPARSVAGSVDISLRTASAGTVLLARDAFTYVDPNSGQQPTTPTTAPATEPTTSTTTSSGGGGGGGAPSTTTPVGGGDSTSTTRSSGGGGGGITSTTTSSGGGGDGGGATTSTPGATTTAPSSSTSTTAADGDQASTTTAVDEPTTTTEPPGVPRRARAQASGAPLDLGGGLEGVPLQGLGGLGDIAVCMSEPCRSQRV